MNKFFLATLLALLAVANLQAQNTVSTTTVAPATDLLASQPAGGQQYLVDAARDPGQGQTFSLPNDFTIEGLTVQIGADTRGAQGAAEDAAALSLNFYQVPIDPMTGEPVLTLDETTLLGSFSDPAAATFDATMAIETPLFLTFDLDAASTAALGTLSANTLYAFTITSTSTTDPGFRIERSEEDEFADGNGIFTNANNIPTLRGPDDAVFFLQGIFDSIPGLCGDVNLDGNVNFLDISPFINALAGDTFQPEADCNGDGMNSFLDISPFIMRLAGGGAEGTGAGGAGGGAEGTGAGGASGGGVF